MFKRKITVPTYTEEDLQRYLNKKRLECVVFTGIKDINMDEEGIKYLESMGQFEMVPLLFIRGRSFENSIIYVTEAQNIDSSIAKVLLSRVGENSEIWFNGDNHN